MYRVLYITLSICFIGCHTNSSKKFVAEENQPSYRENQPLNELYTSPIPLSEKLNIKHFYQFISVSNALISDSNFYCLTKLHPEPTSSLPICGGGYKIYFDSKRVISFCDSMINRLDKSNLGTDVYFDIYEIKKIRKEAIKSLKTNVRFNESFLLDLLPFCRCYIWDTKTQTKPFSLLIKPYKTMCTSKGNDFDLITAKGDTTCFINNLEMCIN